MMKFDSQLTCKFTHIRVRGTSKILTWDGTVGYIEMKPFNVSEEDLKSGEVPINILKEKVNDNGFGCQDILGFHIYFDAYYENGAHLYCVGEIFYNLKEDREMTEIECREILKFE